MCLLQNSGADTQWLMWWNQDFWLFPFRNWIRTLTKEASKQHWVLLPNQHRPCKEGLLLFWGCRSHQTTSPAHLLIHTSQPPEAREKTRNSPSLCDFLRETQSSLRQPRKPEPWCIVILHHSLYICKHTSIHVKSTYSSLANKGPDIH